MKDFINILLILAMVFFAIGIAYEINLFKDTENIWAIAYVPWFILAVMLGLKLGEDYYDS